MFIFVIVRGWKIYDLYLDRILNEKIILFLLPIQDERKIFQIVIPTIQDYVNVNSYFAYHKNDKRFCSTINLFSKLILFSKHH